MDDADIYAYEQELNEQDEWEALHEHELEAAEEELRAMEAAEHRLRSDAFPASQPQPAAPSKPSQPDPERDDPMDDNDDGLTRAQARLNDVLARCSTLLGEEEDTQMEDTERKDDHIARKAKAAAVDAATTASFLHSRPPVDVDSMSVVLKDGRRMFLRKKIASADVAVVRQISADVSSLVPIQDMMELIQQRQIADAIENENAIQDDPMPSLGEAEASDALDKKQTLWLDKYRPQSFIDLLSDERTNREVLGWVKSWDSFVFPRKKLVEGSHPELWHSPRGNKDKFRGAGHNHGEHDTATSDGVDDKRPFEKIILICGPPGAGKTTLANIVARHAGYNPIEVNASDDRTADVLKNKIISAMEMQSVFGSRKPNCIILDEIDGAMNGGDGRTAIAAIQQIVSAPLRAKKSAGGASRKHHPLIRPLICICNDQYASVLRPLRQLAKIFVLDTPSPQRLITRLKFICRQEGLKGSTGALAELCTSGENDIRYCVNALQFQSMQKRHGISSSGAVTSALVGQKDQTRGVFDTMDTVFYQPRSKQMPASQQVQEAALSMGNSSLLINGLDENLPSMIFNDPTMNKICDSFEWLGLADAWDKRVRAEQQFAFADYVPFAAVAVHRACCTSSRRRISYPRAHFDSLKQNERSLNILQALLENAQLHQSLRVSAGVLVVDIVPSLLGILSPNIRRVNPTVQTKEEKVMIQRLIDVMATLGLSFRPKFLPDGSEDYVLEPALHELMRFSNSEQDDSSRLLLPPTVRKMIAREVELERMRRSEPSTSSTRESRAISSANSSYSKNNNSSKPAEAPSEPRAATSKAFVLPELSEAQLAAKDEAMRRRNPFAFAHREAKRKREELAKEQRAGGRGDGDSHTMAHPRPHVRYKFNEGYTSGIKTSVYMRDLF